MEFFFKRSRAAYSTVCSRIVLNFELGRDIIVVLLTCINEEDSIKNEGARVFTTLHIVFFSEAAYSVICSGILPKFELIQALLQVLVTCKNEEDPIKSDGARVFTRLLPFKVYGDFSRRSKAAHSAVHGRIWSNFELL